MKFPALYRRYNEAPIVIGEYNCLTQSLFDLKFPNPIKYVEDFVRNLNEIGEDKYAHMYKAMLDHRDLLAVVLSNNAYLVQLYPKHVLTETFNQKDVRTSDGFYDYSSIHKEEIVPVGFERTFCPTIDVFITPGRIYYSPERDMIFYKNKWQKCPEKPFEFRGKSLYKKLVNQPKGHGILKLSGDDYFILD